MESRKIFAASIAIIGAITLLVMDFFYFPNSASDDLYETPTHDSQGVSADEIVIGSSLALSGHAGQLGTNYLHGALSYINQVNKHGGIHGRTIRLVTYDDQYDPPKTLLNTQQLIIQDKVFALFNYVGTPTTLKALPLIHETRIPLLGMFTGAHRLRNPVYPSVFNVRASYYEEMETAVTYFVRTKDITNIAVFYQADAYGLDGLEGAKIALDRHNLQPIATTSYIRGTLDVERAAQEIIASGVQGVLMVGTYSPTAKFVSLVKAKKPDMIFHSVSFVGPEDFAAELRGQTDNVYVTQVVPPPTITEASIHEAIREYREATATFFPAEQPTLGGMEGYLNAQVLVQALRACGTNLTRTCFISTLEHMKDVPLGIGTNLNFSNDNHQGLHKIFLTRIKQNEFELIEQ